MSTQICYASTFFGAVNLAAAADAGLLGHPDRRVLLVSNNVAVPEVTPALDESPGFAAIADRWDDVVHWNELIAPMHPAGWTPPDAELPLLGRWLRAELGRHEPPSELVVESIAVAPARTVAALLLPCPITVYADGLMSYGPTREGLPRSVAGRVTRLLYPELVPGVDPLLLREFGVDTQPLPAAELTAAFATTTPVAREPDSDPPGAGCPVIVGQYLAQLGVVTPDEEHRLYADMVDALAARGERRVVFRPHPAARREQVPPLARHAASRGVDLLTPDDGLSAEAWFAIARPTLVVSCFSTALFTATRYYGLDVATMGTAVVLDRLTPFENSNRLPATLADAGLPRLNPDGTVAPPTHEPGQLRALARAVGYCMQAGRLPDLREDAVDYLAGHGPERYFKRKRLAALGLMAAPSPIRGRVSRVLRRGR